LHTMYRELFILATCENKRARGFDGRRCGAGKIRTVLSVGAEEGPNCLREGTSMVYYIFQNNCFRGEGGEFALPVASSHQLVANSPPVSRNLPKHV
jgi:hypothetical protein